MPDPSGTTPTTPTWRCRIPGCTATGQATTRDAALAAFNRHVDTHDTHPPMQLASTTFREQALDAIQQLAATGKPFAIAQAHDLVTATPVDPRTAWPAVTREAVKLGLIEWAGEYTDSPLATTKGSAVKLWRGRKRTVAA